MIKRPLAALAVLLIASSLASAQSPPTIAAQMSRVSLGDLNGMLPEVRSSTPPVLPAELAATASSSVEIETVSGVDGAVIDARVGKSSGTEAVDRATLDALRQWRFTPMRVGSQPAAMLFIVRFTFAPSFAATWGTVRMHPRDRSSPPAPETVMSPRPGSGIVNPKTVRQIEPHYTAAAMRAKIMGDVELEVVILPDGTVSDVRVRRSLDAEKGLDAMAVECARYWLFEPATLDGRPVPVRVTIVQTFKLH